MLSLLFNLLLLFKLLLFKLLLCRYIVSPVTMKKQVKELWEKEKMFDTILALTIPCKLTPYVYV